jgi:hypothetical protein
VVRFFAVVDDRIVVRTVVVSVFGLILLSEIWKKTNIIQTAINKCARRTTNIDNALKRF